MVMNDKEVQLWDRIKNLQIENKKLEDALMHYFEEATNFQSVTELVRNYPNNQELGKFVRALVMKYTDSLLSKPNK